MKKILLFTIGVLFLSVGYLQAQQNAPLRRIEKNGKWGYVDEKGDTVVHCKYDHAYPFYESDLALVGSEGKFGYINKQGQVIIPLQYKKAYPFSEERAAVKKERSKKFGFINNRGQEIIKPDYSEVKWGFVGDYAWVKKGNNWGMIYKSGATAVAFKYARLSNFDPSTNVADAVTKDGVTHYYFKGKKYASKRERDEAMNPKPNIIWPVIPAVTEQPQFALKAEVESKSEIEYCKVYLNGIEVMEDNKPGGSFIAKDPDRQENYKVAVDRTLALKDGMNIITIKAKNSGGEKEEEKTIEFRKSIPVKALVVWNDLPATTTESRLELDATVKSTVKEVSCRVLLNGVEVPKTKGSSIVEDSKEIEYKYKLSVTRTIVLQEGNNGDNIITIEVRNAKGESVKSEQKQVTFAKPMLATIEWGDVPSYTEEKNLTLRAQIVSESPIEYYSILKDEKLLKRVEKASNVKTRGSIIAKDPQNELDDRSVSIEELVELDERDNSFVIQVKNEGGIVRSQRKNVNYRPKEKRIALVIGNANYSGDNKLNNPVNDADEMTKKLRSLGFEVEEVTDKNKEAMEMAINGFATRARNYDVALFYYSGHGIGSHGANYLIPIDADVPREELLQYRCTNTQMVLDLMNSANCSLKIMILDACRNNPYTKSWKTRGANDNGGLVYMSTSEGTFIAYATAPGETALDGEGEHSPYTQALLNALDIRGLSINDLFDHVYDEVVNRTKHTKLQTPWYSKSSSSKFVFNKKDYK